MSAQRVSVPQFVEMAVGLEQSNVTMVTATMEMAAVQRVKLRTTTAAVLLMMVQTLVYSK